MRNKSNTAARRAVIDGTVIADSPETQTVDRYEYFPPDVVRWDLLERSDLTSTCPWKGKATYYDVVVGDRRYPNVAWTYEQPKDAALHIKGHVGFWRKVRVENS